MHHESTESLERSGDSDGGVDFDENTSSGVDIHLQLPRFVERRVEERKEALVSDVGSSVGNIPAHLGEDTLVIVAVEQTVFILPFGAAGGGGS